MTRNHLIVGLAAVGALVFSGTIIGCGHTEVATVTPVVPVATVVAVAPPPPPPPAPRLVPPCDATIGTGGHVKFPKEVEFEIGKATLKSDSTTTTTILQCLVDFLNNNKMVTKFRVEGHTDNAGDATANMTLSQQRAEAAIAWMVAHGTNPGMIYGKGFGPNRPLVPNDSPEHMAQNRRLEFHIDELNGAKATKEAITLAQNPPATVVTTTAVVTTPAVGVAVPAVAAPTVGVVAPTVGVGVVAPTVGVGVATPTVGVGVTVPASAKVGVTVGPGAPGAAGAPATAKKDEKKDEKKKQ
jgi:outer membrane protein OmpA-like peptidoglycan-associated protein